MQISTDFVVYLACTSILLTIVAFVALFIRQVNDKRDEGSVNAELARIKSDVVLVGENITSLDVRLKSIDAKAHSVDSAQLNLRETVENLINKINSRERTERKRLRELEHQETETPDGEEEIPGFEQMNMFPPQQPPIPQQRQRKFGELP